MAPTAVERTKLSRERVNLGTRALSHRLQTEIVPRETSAILHDWHQQRLAVELFVGLTDRVAGEDSVIEPAQNLLSPRVYHLAAGELGAPDAVVLDELVSHIQRRRILGDHHLGTNREPVDRAVVVHQRRHPILVKTRRGKNSDLGQTCGVELGARRLRQRTEIPESSRIARTSKRSPERSASLTT